MTLRWLSVPCLTAISGFRSILLSDQQDILYIHIPVRIQLLVYISIFISLL